MQPENLILWANGLLKSSPSVQFANFTWPCVAALNSRYSLRTDTKTLSDGLLLFPRSDSYQNGFISAVKFVNSLLHSVYDFQGIGQSRSLNLNVRFYKLEDKPTVIAVSHRKRPQWTIALFLSALVLPYCADSKSCVNIKEDSRRRKTYSQSHSTFARMNLDTSFSVNKCSQISIETIIRHFLYCHYFIISGSYPTPLYLETGA